MATPAHKLLFIGIDGAVPAAVLGHVTEGALPNIARLIAHGTWFDNCLPAFPTITPTCWATLATGATPATHGVTCQHLHEPGTPLDQFHWSYRSETCRAERFWEAAARAGKRTLVLGYPTSGPARAECVLQVNGTSCTALEYLPPDMSPNAATPARYHGVGARFFTTQNPASAVEWLAGATPPSGQWQGPQPASAQPAATPGDCRMARLHVEAKDSLWGVAPFDWFVELAGDQVLIRHDLGDAEPQTAVPVGGWSPLLERTLCTEHGPHTFRYQIRVVEADARHGVLSLFVTPLADFRPAVNQPDLAQALYSIPKIAQHTGHSGFFGSGLVSNELYNEIEEMNLDWLASASERAWQSHSCDATVAYTVAMDTINHKYRNIIEGLAGDAVLRAKATAMQLRGYQIIDAFIGRLVRSAGPETLVVLASDHGSVGYGSLFSPHEALRKAGLLVTRPAAGGQGEEVVWEKTRAVPFGSVHIYVNLQGRDPQGIVALGDYERTVRDIVAALHDYRDPKTGTKAVALALPKGDAALLGLGGERTGDVIWGVSGRIGGHVGGVHACQIPTAASPTGDIRALLLMAGPPMRAGSRVAEVVRQWDVAPTLCQAMGWPIPAQAEGRIIRSSLA